MAELKVKEEYALYSNEDLLLVISYKEDDETEAKKAFSVFYQRNAQWFFALCKQVCSTITECDLEELSKDVFSKTMLNVWENADKYDSTRSKVQTWVSNTARYVMYNILAEYKGKVSGDLTFVPINNGLEIASNDDSEDYSKTETPEMLALATALMSLADRDRDILLTYMRYSDGNKHLPENELDYLCSKYLITSDNVRQIKGRALGKVKKHIDNVLNKK